MKMKILNRSGHTELNLKPQEAFEKMQQVDPNHWAFVDGVYMERRQITVTILKAATELVLTPELQAG
jgi:hypothetical protein